MPDLGFNRSSPRRDPSTSSKRNSITDRVRNSFLKARQDTQASIQRRTSTAPGKPTQSPISRIRDWLDTCNREHDHHCSPPSSSKTDDEVDTFRPTWLIDSTDRCLVRSKPGDRYVALSYVWGGGARTETGDIRLAKANIDVYEDALPEADLPQTILDAMWTARKLGLRYLWVDQLCITQDDKDEMESHTQHMAYVFANAYLTLVAAHGDVHTGLIPLNPRRQGPRGLGSGTENHADLVRQSKWSTRGWTLEESYYSRRKVFFFEDAITWECHCELWQDSPTAAVRGRRAACAHPLSEAAFAWRHAPWPDLDEYARIAADYSARRVTRVDDTLKAFAGITHVLSRVFPGGFLYGMPLMFLDIALLWRPQASMRRRAVIQPPFLPSWSWMGWWFDGVPVDLVLWRAAADYVVDKTSDGSTSQRLQSPHAFKIKPTVTWALTDRTASAPVTNNGLHFRDLRSRRSSVSSYPPGWTRVGPHFQHDSDDLTLFRYPIPVEEPPEDGVAYPAPAGELAFPGPYLSFRTTSALFEVDYDATLSTREAAMNPPVAVGNLWSRTTQRWAGSFRAHDGWLGIQSSNYEGDEVLEFVAISTATERRGSHVFSAAQFAANKDADDFVDIVNVLWIERIGGVAYRRGLGHVLRKAWEGAEPEEVDVLLG
ncbi:tol protein [Emericellopsis atlantica]|uniref:Tol protein n=1 Tax=Emericellopsis atlantica TaxID=2614577 RepID=A0A9P7ZKE7_9HYPO|nr:tol protein [Emericellopsis atlantica]KAG9253326.1 tol protein [Emericellopsis atlantica]